ncbi:hypothetical protein [Halobacillus sp. Nhm2S1]|uniref:hypothetical protein n=1 Tax=Halobacillus sp. Nhm2S1 TaxID=2866716 RepID=UPI001C72ABD7|nr:hypothetical protein [Halobacillus sp. Nhm2S1]MBX0356805.1 hypothetical protein [Halobacillus sp. Nhm2S1]
MFETIHWRIFIEASSKEKAEKVTKKLSQEIGELHVLKFERYWKDEKLFEIGCTTNLQLENPERAVFQVLQKANQLGREVLVRGPFLNEGKQVEFEGICSSPTFTGVKWFHFTIDNFRS